MGGRLVGGRLRVRLCGGVGMPCGFAGEVELVTSEKPTCNALQDIAGFLLKLAISRRTCDIERNLLRGYR